MPCTGKISSRLLMPTSKFISLYYPACRSTVGKITSYPRFLRRNPGEKAAFARKVPEGLLLWSVRPEKRGLPPNFSPTGAPEERKTADQGTTMLSRVSALALES